MASSPIRGKDQNCCFWTKQSEGCAQVKHGGAAIVAALVAIALVAGGLLILAQNGYNLAGINSIAQMVEAKWIYLGMGIAGALLVIDTTLIIAQVNSYLNKTIPQNELEQRKLFYFLSHNHIGERLAPKSYALLPAKADDHFSSAYAIAMKNKDGEVSTIAYRTFAEAEAHLDRLQKEEGYVDGLALEKTEYQPAYMEAKMEPQFFQRIQRSLSDGLGLGMLRVGHFVIDQTQVRSLAVHTEEGVRLRFFNTEAARGEAICADYTTYFNQEEANSQSERQYRIQVKVTLWSNAFWEYDCELSDSQKLYCVAYGTHTRAEIASFLSAERRGAFIKETLGEDAVDAKAVFNTPTPYTPEEASWLIKSDQMQWLRRNHPHNGNYETIDLQMAARPQLFIYALKAGGEPQPLFFKTQRDRQAHIDAHLQRKIDHGAVERSLFGFEDKQGVMQRENVHTFCKNVNEYWPCTLHVNDIQVFALICKQSPGWSFVYYDSQESLLKSLQADGINGASKGYANAQARHLQTATLVEHIVTAPGEYLCEHAPVGMYVFYREGSDLAWTILAPANVQTFLGSKKLVTDAKEKLAKSEEYPRALGIQLAALARSSDERSLLQKVPYLAKREYASFTRLQTNAQLYPSVFMIMIKAHKGDIQFRYFKSDQARSAFIKKENLRNGYVRDRNREVYIKRAAPAIYKEQTTVPQKPLLFTFEHPDHETTCFITYAADGEISKEYVPAGNVTDRLRDLQASYVYITPDALAVRPLSADEHDYLDRETRSSEPGKLSHDGHSFERKELKEKQYVISKKTGGYIALLIRKPDAADQKASPFEVLFYRPNSPEYPPKLAELEAQGYKNAEAK